MDSFIKTMPKAKPNLLENIGYIYQNKVNSRQNRPGKIFVLFYTFRSRISSQFYVEMAMVKMAEVEG